MLAKGKVLDILVLNFIWKRIFSMQVLRTVGKVIANAY